LIVAAACATMLGASMALALSAGAAVPPTPSGWSLLWSDDFTGSANTLPSSANWIIDTGTSYPGGPANWGTGEIQTYTNSTSNLSLDGNGNLRITPLRNGSGQWTSARIETVRSNFKPAAGRILRIEGRIQMPNVTGTAALGYWPAFWALGSPYRGNFQNWPSIGEFDIMENVNGINNVYGVLHCGVSPGGPCNETNGIGANRACPGSSCQSAFHTYRFEWDATNGAAEQLRWYVDGQQFHTINEAQLPAATWTNMTSHAGYFILLNVAMGGGFPNGVSGMTTPVAGTASGVPMLIDYVAVWQNNGTTTTTPPPTTPSGGGVLLSQGHPALASSTENANFPASNAFDGSTATRWSSAFSDPQWIRVDLGSPQTINRVVLNWEAAYSSAYQVQTSNDGNSWNTIFSTTTGNGGIDDLAVSGSGRFVRMNGTARGTQWGHSLWEFQVYGPGTAPTTPPPTTPPPTTPAGTRDAYSTIQAESFNAQSGVGVETTTDTGGGQNIGFLANGDWAQYNNVNFGSTSPVDFITRVASGAAGGVSGLVEVRIDNVNNAPIGSFAVGNTGGWQSWTTVPANVTPVTGIHTVFLRFTSGQPAEFVNVNWFQFRH
jgi:hypothetical protein